MKKFTLILSLIIFSTVVLVVAEPVIAQGCADGGPCLDPLEGPTSEDFDNYNPLKDSDYAGELSNPGGILSRLLTFSLPIAGLILFLMLVWSGFQIIANSGNKQAIADGSKRATHALIGFILLFCSYFIFELIGFIFGIDIL